MRGCLGDKGLNMQIDIGAVTVGALAGVSLAAHVVAFTLLKRQRGEIAAFRGEAARIRRDMGWGFRDVKHALGLLHTGACEHERNN